jgi:hypothetical protein
MPDNDQTKGRPQSAGTPDEQDQRTVSRRSLLGVAGVGAAGLAAGAFGGLAAAGPALAATGRPAPAHGGREETGGKAAAGEPVVVHLRDARTGELDVYSGTSHTRLRDPDLAARLVRTIR